MGKNQTHDIEGSGDIHLQGIGHLHFDGHSSLLRQTCGFSDPFRTGIEGVHRPTLFRCMHCISAFAIARQTHRSWSQQRQLRRPKRVGLHPIDRVVFSIAFVPHIHSSKNGNWRLPCIMRKTKISLALVFLLLALFQVHGRAQPDTSTADSLLVRSLFNEVLAHGEAHENLRVLCKDIGHRLSGSPSAGRAMDWGNP